MIAVRSDTRSCWTPAATMCQAASSSTSSEPTSTGPSGLRHQLLRDRRQLSWASATHRSASTLHPAGHHRLPARVRRISAARLRRRRRQPAARLPARQRRERRRIGRTTGAPGEHGDPRCHRVRRLAERPPIRRARSTARATTDFSAYEDRDQVPFSGSCYLTLAA